MNGEVGPAAGRPVLAIDAAPGVGSVAIVRGRDVLGARAVAMRPPVKQPVGGPPGDGPRGDRSRDDEDPLMRAIASTLRDAGLTPRDLAAVACGAGPGGFTSLRIAAALAKGLAHAAAVPLLAAPSLAWAAAVRAPAAGVWLVTLDALRGERYVARVALADAGNARPRAPRPVTRYDYLGVHASDAIAPLGAMHHAPGVLDIDADPTAAPIATGAVALPPSPVDLARWEPAYGRLAEAQARWEAAHGPLQQSVTPAADGA